MHSSYIKHIIGLDPALYGWVKFNVQASYGSLGKITPKKCDSGLDRTGNKSGTDWEWEEIMGPGDT